MKYFSMFSGIGGFEKAIKNIHPEWECVGFSEIDKYAIQIYKKHFGGHKNYGNASKIRPEELPKFDILMGGFPCQSFSIAGKRRGFEDTRGTLFFDIARIVAVKKPKILFLENVKGLLNHDGGSTFARILETLWKLGYNVEWQVLNSRYYTGQNRERTFIIGHLRGESFRRILPIYYKHEVNIKASEDSWKTHFTCITTRSPKARLNIDSTYIVDKRGVRAQTPLETERLQGFPDGTTTEGTAGKISDTQRYKCLGNAVTVNVIEAIVSRMEI